MAEVDAFFRHGGRLGAAKRAFAGAPTPWIDLSTGINPWGYPAPRPSRADLSRLPDPEDVAKLEALAAAAFGVADPACVAAVAGAETALRILPHAAPASAVAVSQPTYGSHGEAWRASGAQVLSWPDDEARARIVVIVNPNNPDGRVVSPADLLATADRLSVRGGLLVVDESFIDLTPDMSVAGRPHPALYVLRSFGKTYGLPGVRLGFVVADPELVGRLRTFLGDWPLCAAALAAGLAAYGDPGWLIRVRSRLRLAAATLDGDLAAAGFDVVGGTDLFRLARAPDAGRRFRALCAQGVLTRPFGHAPDSIRFGLPRVRERARLRRALAAL